MTRQMIRSTLGTLVLAVTLALVTATVASQYAGAYFDAPNAGGGPMAAAPGWSDLMGVLEACAAGSECAITVASSGETFHWTAEGPMLALADDDLAPCEAAAPAGGVGGTRVADGTPPPGTHKLRP